MRRRIQDIWQDRGKTKNIHPLNWRRTYPNRRIYRVEASTRHQWIKIAERHQTSNVNMNFAKMNCYTFDLLDRIGTTKVLVSGTVTCFWHLDCYETGNYVCIASAATWENVPPPYMSDQRRLKSACASALSDQSLRWPSEEILLSWLSKMRSVKILIRLR